MESLVHEPVVKRRIEWIDAFRGLAIVFMVVYHFFYDLHFFGWYDTAITGPDGWWMFRFLILTLFISLMAISLNKVHEAKFNKKKYGVWFAKVGGASLLVSLGTSFIYPSSWVYFGILHFMVFASFFVVVLRRFRVLCFVLGACIIGTHLLNLLPYGWPISSIRHFFHNGKSVDYVTVFPWLGVALLASSVSTLALRLEWLNEVSRYLPKFLQVMGQYSLSIYLLHQAILFGLMYAVQYLIGQ